MDSIVKVSPESILSQESCTAFKQDVGTLSLLFIGSLNFFTMLNLWSNVAKIVIILLFIFFLPLKAVKKPVASSYNL